MSARPLTDPQRPCQTRELGPNQKAYVESMARKIDIRRVQLLMDEQDEKERG